MTLLAALPFHLLCAQSCPEPAVTSVHAWSKDTLPGCVNRAVQVMGGAGFNIAATTSWYVMGKRPRLEAWIHCHRNPDTPAIMALTVIVAGCGASGQNEIRDSLGKQMTSTDPATPPPGPPAGSPPGGSQIVCDSTTLQPASSGLRFDGGGGGQPAGFAWSSQTASTADQCCRLCQSFTGGTASKFVCKSFLFNQSTNSCYLVSHDTSSENPDQRLKLNRRDPGWQYYERPSQRPKDGGGGGGSQDRGLCADPRTLPIMDEWLANAIPAPSGNYRFDSWARIIGENTGTSVRNVNQPVDPYIWATRCDYLLSVAARLQSRNLGTMLDYVRSRLR
jgi:hypothetical protein